VRLIIEAGRNFYRDLVTNPERMQRVQTFTVEMLPLLLTALIF
jgi:hypothetical protein